MCAGRLHHLVPLYRAAPLYRPVPLYRPAVLPDGTTVPVSQLWTLRERPTSPLTGVNLGWPDPRVLFFHLGQAANTQQQQVPCGLAGPGLEGLRPWKGLQWPCYARALGLGVMLERLSMPPPQCWVSWVCPSAPPSG